jgi:hypothetical protein
MKKRIVVISLSVNLIAALFILYSFVPKEKRSGNEEGGVIIVSADYALGKLIVTDNSKLVDLKEIHNILNLKNIEENQQNICKVLDDYYLKGYEIVTSNSIGDNNGYGKLYYVLKKK